MMHSHPSAEFDFSSMLNEAQLEAVTYCGGPALVIAGAGSGKTRVLTYRIAYLLSQQGCPPWQILALTFTNKAAAEMKARIGRLVGEELTRDLAAGTFHSVFLRILHVEHEAIGYDANFAVYDTSDQRALLKSIVRELQLDEKTYKPATVSSKISAAKNRLMLPAAYRNDAGLAQRDKRNDMPALGLIYETYQKRLRRTNAMDFDDLLLNMFLLLRDHPDIREKYKQRYCHILVDEYQDTNFAQYSIIRQLTDADSNLCVVGDDAQSIYGFRGADIGNILGFERDYPGMRLIKLEENYRSTSNIVNAANSLISHNDGRIPKNVFSRRGEGDKLCIMTAYSDREEALKVARYIRQLNRRDGVGFNEIAILYRTNAQSRAFEEAFRNTDLPYRVYGGLSFYQRKEVKDLLGYLRVVANPLDDEALLRIINYPARGIGQTTLLRLQTTAARTGQPLWNVLCHLETVEKLNRGTIGKLQAFASLIQHFRDAQEHTGAYDLAAQIFVKSGMEADLKADHTPESIARQENMEELLNSIRDYEADLREQEGKEQVDLSEYLPQVALLTDQDQQEADNEEEKVTLMTIHAAKGLEFEAVFITGLEEDLFPTSSARFSRNEMEEERRLFYVALTRAKSHCFISYAQSRYKYGNLEFSNPSRFIDEIDPRYLMQESGRSHREKPATFNRRQYRSESPSAPGVALMCGGWLRRETFRQEPLPRAIAATDGKDSGGGREWNIRIGSRIEHNRFGLGTVKSIEGTGPSTKALVSFDTAGEKNLLLKFAKFTVIE